MKKKDFLDAVYFIENLFFSVKRTLISECKQTRPELANYKILIYLHFGLVHSVDTFLMHRMIDI